jgi:deoxyribodipyrimidine photo-lyase
MNIFLFHRDLRLHDNTTLIALANIGTIMPIFIFPPGQISDNPYFSNNSVQFMVESLEELAGDIDNGGGRLNFFSGDTLGVLKDIHHQHKLNSIGFNIDYTPYAKKRDVSIHDWCTKVGIKYITLEDYYLYPILSNDTKKKDSTPYLIFTPFKNHCLNDLKVRTPDTFKDFKFDNHSIKSKYSISTQDTKKFYIPNPDIAVRGGRKNGLSILKGISKFGSYEKNRNLLTYKTTHLSAHLHFTTVSIREVYHKMRQDCDKPAALISELHWRDFYANITHEFPHILAGQIGGHNRAYKPSFDKIKWSHSSTWFSAWCEGKTGFPIVDAGMHQLNKTGYMHNRCRMIVASFLTKDMHIDWREGERYFATKLVDYDPMSNNGGWQWSAGCGVDAQPWFRIFNPWVQQEKFDKDCEYIKHWCPALRDIPPKIIHKWHDTHVKYPKLEYPKPILNHDEEREKTLKLYNFK